MDMKETKRIFKENFDRESFEKVKDELMETLHQANSSQQAMDSTFGYDLDEDDCCGDSFYVERELDRSRLATEADFVSVEFLVWWKNGEPIIDQCYLNISGDPTCDSLRCSFDPITCEPEERIW